MWQESSENTLQFLVKEIQNFKFSNHKRQRIMAKFLINSDIELEMKNMFLKTAMLLTELK